LLIKQLEVACHRLPSIKPKKKWYRHFCKRSAVAIILRQGECGLEALMIKRAEREGDPWSGHMGFPGGRAESIDQSSLHTATRESWEEIGLDMDQHTDVVGRLSDLLAQPQRRRKPMIVTPHLFAIQQVPKLTINYEVAEVIWIPLSFLVDKTNRQTMTVRRHGVVMTLPCYIYRERTIWGMSLNMLDELVLALKEKNV
jgi:8-oxo-dGTP pyrophosphatase MutT (NUDIX family)